MDEDEEQVNASALLAASFNAEQVGQAADLATSFEKFEAATRDLKVPGIEFISGAMGGQFYFQTRYHFSDLKGVRFEGLGGYYFPELRDLSCRRRMLFLLRDAAGEAFRIMVTQSLSVDGHRPFSTYTALY